MKQIILESPKQFKTGIEAAKDIKPKSSFNKIIICGLGGSALPANILTTSITNIKMPVYSHRSYGLPAQADKKSLVVVISYSGDTEETVSAYKKSLEKGLKPIAITTGGKLQELAQKNNLPIAIIPKNAVQPRFALGYLTSALMKILSNGGIIKDQTENLLRLSETFEPIRLENVGKLLAEKLVDKIPVVYASNQFKSVARIWKIKFNENSKIMAFFNYFPELNHNEMVGLTNLKANFHFIVLNDKNDHPDILKRMRLFDELVEKKAKESDTNTAIDFIELSGKNNLEKVFNSLILADWTSYYLALKYNQDPVAVKIVEDFKERLAQ